MYQIIYYYTYINCHWGFNIIHLLLYMCYMFFERLLNQKMDTYLLETAHCESAWN